MKALLSTRTLAPEYRKALEEAGWSVVEYDAIAVELLPAQFEPRGDAAIFTSQNAVRACFAHPAPGRMTSKPCLCVGPATADLLRQHGLEVLETARTAEALASRIRDKYNEWSFTYYCGESRLETLPKALDTMGITWQEIQVYRTVLTPREFPGPFEGILFFSPSGVESHAAVNSLGEATAYCIGPTTAKAARKYTHRVICPEIPGIDALVSLILNQSYTPSWKTP